MPIKTTDAERQRVKQIWDDGERDISQIGRMMGHSHGWVTNRLAELGIGAPTKNRKQMTK